MKKDLRDSFYGFWFVLPALLGTFVFIVIPIFCSFLLSFTEWDLLNEIKFVGFTNYKAIFSLIEFRDIFINTLVYALSTTIFAVGIPLLLADVLNRKICGTEFFKSIYFLPFITPAVVIAIVWSWVFDPNIGGINLLFKTNLEWLFDTRLAMPVLIFVSVWKLIGYNVVLFLTGFSTINQNIYEAAKIDGAGARETFFKITLPLMKPTIYFVTLVTAISSFQVFDLIYVMTEGGPQNSTNVIVYSVFKYAFEYFDIGKSCALAYILFLVILILSIFVKRHK